MKKLLTLIALIMGAMVLAACGGNDGDGTGRLAADHNAADVTFAQNMIPHHRQAVEMAGLAETQAASPEVKTLARQIRDAQAPEIATMVGWLNDWDESTMAPDSGQGGGHDMNGHGGGGGGMNDNAGGMMSEGGMASLKNASGAVFDRMFLEMMIEHHRGAVEMAQTELRDGRYGPAKELADSIKNTQNTEIATMQDLLGRV
ncbi:DUF305 domain-containing protein [Frankia sp. Mgl5]|uniref:DUF305 domain-containing protein n=1 Tax=Frankia sp. Mgl5 TaxID=2933793 RepID=UPI0020103C66|nr:DUF305 domain-containing protein [Frankia sp. Mgl5]MCK9929947.1 DUF305 domain-containing protein [Frankia sp. Mgl5]